MTTYPSGYTAAQRYFGQSSISTAIGFVLAKRSPRVVVRNPSIAGSVTLPDARELSPGGTWFYVLNLNGTFTLSVFDNDTNLVHTLAAGGAVELYLTDSSTAAGVWRTRTRVMSSEDEPLAAKAAYLLGGITSNDASISFEPSTGAWTTNTAGGQGHRRGCAFALSAGAFVCGTDDDVFVDVYQPPPTDAWGAKLDLTAIMGTYANAAGDFSTWGFVAGGIDVLYIDHLHRYIAAPESWNQAADIPVDCAWGAMASGGGYLWLSCGSTSTLFSASERTLQRYEHGVNTWTLMLDSPYPDRAQHCCSHVAGELFIMHGNNGDGTAAFNIDLVHRYTIASDAWDVRTAFPGTDRFAAGCTNASGLIYSSGGRTTLTAGLLDDAWIYHPTADAWRASVDLVGGASADFDQQTVPL